MTDGMLMREYLADQLLSGQLKRFSTKFMNSAISKYLVAQTQFMLSSLMAASMAPGTATGYQAIRSAMPDMICTGIPETKSAPSARSRPSTCCIVALCLQDFFLSSS